MSETTSDTEFKVNSENPSLGDSESTSSENSPEASDSEHSLDESSSGLLDSSQSLNPLPSADQTESSGQTELSVNPEQQQLPLAKVAGQPVTEIPQDLYIPPEALEVFLDAFEGPLDLLLYLIRKQNIDILDINISSITAQYMEYVELMKATRFELAAEYLVMAAMLAEIKSRSLLPRQNEGEEEEEDPRAELIRRLQEYERFKVAAEQIDEMPRVGREVLVAQVRDDEFEHVKRHPDVDLREVLLAMSDILKRAEMFEHHHISQEVLSTRERMSEVLSKVKHGQLVSFQSLFTVEEGKMGVVVTFLAVMELVKESLIMLQQSDVFGEIHVRARTEAADCFTEDMNTNAALDEVEPKTSVVEDFGDGLESDDTNLADGEQGKESDLTEGVQGGTVHE